MRRRGIFLAIVAAAIATLLLAAFARFDVNGYRAQIQTEMEQRLGRKVALGNLSIKLIPVRLRVESLSISEDPDFGGRAPFLKADTADLSVRLLPLLGRKVEISGIDVQRPSVEMVKSTKGVWNFSSLGQGNKQTSSARVTGDTLRGSLVLHDGQVAVTNLQKGGNRKVYDHIDATLQ